MVWMTFCPASYARMEASMSTMVRVGSTGGEGGAGADGADRLAAAGVGEHDLLERALRDAVGLVAGRRAVREVVGQKVLAGHLGEHAGGSDVQTAVHLPSSARRVRS